MTTSRRRVDLTTDARRDRYAQQLIGAMEQIARFPELGAQRNQLAPGLRAYPIEQHVIFYRVDEQAIAVIRILHIKMDAASQIVS